MLHYNFTRNKPKWLFGRLADAVFNIMQSLVVDADFPLERESNTWKAFKNILTTEEDVEAVETLMDVTRAHASAGDRAVNPI